MLKLRRGFLAAGLAVAVTGAIGVVSVMSAQADEQVQDVPAAGGGTEAGEHAPVPPTELPWGGKPSRMRVGKPGTPTNQLRNGEVGADTTGAPRAHYGPKGRIGPSPLWSEKTDVKLPRTTTKSKVTGGVPPQPAGAETQATMASTVNYFYARATQRVTSTKVYATLYVSRPALHEADYHTLAEIAVQSPDGKQTVEVGWKVDYRTYKNYDPHLFVFHWVNGEPGCYNGCGWEPNPDAQLQAGATLAEGATQFGIEYKNGGWHIALANKYLGSFPAGLWTEKGATFETSEYFQLYGEVASTTTAPCSDMGNGTIVPAVFDAKAVAFPATFGTINVLNGTTNIVPALKLATETNNSQIKISAGTYGILAHPVSPRTFFYGGPGYC